MRELGSMRAILSALLIFFGVSRKNKGQGPNIQWVPSDSLKPGPIKHEELSPNHIERIHKLRDTLAEVDHSPIEKWVDNFRRDANPDEELAVWEIIADTYAHYCSQKQLSLSAKEDVFQLLLLRSMTSEQEVLNHVELKVLTVDEAKEVLKGF